MIPGRHMLVIAAALGGVLAGAIAVAAFVLMQYLKIQF